MRIAVLSQNPYLYSTKRFVEAGQRAGYDMRVVDYLLCHVQVVPGEPSILYQDAPLPRFDAAIPRVPTSETLYGTAVVRQLEAMGVYTPNSAVAIQRSRDKLRCLQVLSRHDIPMPVTAFGHARQDVKGLIRAVGGPPLVVKLLEGTQGVGVVLCENQNTAESVIESFRNLGAHMLVQSFVKEARGQDIRCFVVGERVVASMLRTAPEGEFRSNVHRGGKATKVDATDAERDVAIRAAKALNLKVAGVDILRGADGPLLIEVNSSPGLEGIERASGADVAGAVVRFVAKRAREQQAR